MPDYEIRTAGRIGPVVASCLPHFRSVVPPATVLRTVVTNHLVLLELLETLTDHHLTVIDVRINPAQPRPIRPLRYAAGDHNAENTASASASISPRPPRAG